ncbi:MAG: S-layer homology domain-containing protein, partial [Clostridiales bacterium]|nr:S-layer homology domain-containing protein [Clostridiales bacterium]
TLSGFKDGLTVSIPFAPSDGQLAYSFTLYFVDDTGKVHEIPCAYDKDTGKVEFITDKLPRFFTSALTIESDKAYSLYTDVPASSWYFDYVLYVHEKGFMRGTADGLFEPDKIMSRAMLANTIYNMAGMPDFDESPGLPPDVGNRWYKTAVEWVLLSNIAQLNSDGGFGPEDPATREQMADMLWRYAVFSGKGAANGNLPGIINYADFFAISHDKREGLDWACSRGIITGSGDERLWPQKTATRAETAAAIKRFYEKLQIN